MIFAVPVYHSVLNKCESARDAFNQEEALVGAISVIVTTEGSFAALVLT